MRSESKASKCQSQKILNASALNQQPGYGLLPPSLLTQKQGSSSILFNDVLYLLQHLRYARQYAKGLGCWCVKLYL
jgi:hypothetical protein